MRPTILKSAAQLVEVESGAIESLKNVVQEEAFIKAVTLLMECRGRVVVTGMGKSGLIAKKISATLASTGTASLFLHPAEALHGDLGMTREHDVFIALSNSGDTEEIVALLPSLRLFGNRIIAITGKADSTLAQEADAAILYRLEEEGCPIGLAPMASTTISLVLGDALAATLMQLKGFQRRDFARFHPKGSLGRKVLTRVRDLMIRKIPKIQEGQKMNEALQIMIETNLGAVIVADSSQSLVGLISDGDVKRHLHQEIDFLSLDVSSVMTRNPLSIEQDELAETALRVMETGGNPISVLPVIHENRVVGLIRLHDIVQAKIK